MTVTTIRNMVAGDKCPHCGAPVEIVRGIEVGQVFELGTKYSEALHATFLDQNGKAKPYVMGCYGIGVTRTIAAAIEQFHDEHGIMWPVAIAPFEVAIVPVSSKDQDQVRIAGDLYQPCRLPTPMSSSTTVTNGLASNSTTPTSSAIPSGSRSARRALPKALSKSRSAGLANRKSFLSTRPSPASRKS